MDEETKEDQATAKVAAEESKTPELAPKEEDKVQDEQAVANEEVKH